MEPRKGRSFLLLALTAFTLRAFLSWLTQTHPIFPSYYYNDSRVYDAVAWQYAQYWSGTGPEPTWMPPYAVYQNLIGAFYWLLGHRVLLAKLLNAAFGALTAAAIAGLGERLFDRRAGLIAGWLFALWPSCIFFNSQVHKDNVILALSFGGLLLLAAALRRLAEDKPAWGFLAAGGTLLLAGTLFRLPVMMILTVAFALTNGLQWLRMRRIPARAALQTALFLLVLAGARQLVFQMVFAPHSGQIDAVLDKIQASAVEIRSAPTSPAALSEFRRRRMGEVEAGGRPVQTLILPQTEFRSWLDVALFFPQGLFYSAFMPLPGLYPLEGNAGRWAAALENVAALLLTLLGLWGAAAARRDSAHWLILLSIGGLAALSALVEIDLGSASRHKLQYLPLVFLFSAAALPRLQARLAGGRA